MQDGVLPPAAMLVELLKDVGLLALVALLYADLQQRVNQRSLAWPVACGLLFGIAAVMTMIQPIWMAPGIFIDARSVVLGLAASAAGPLAALVAGVIAGAYRLWLGGIGAAAGLTSIIATTAVGIVFASAMAARGTRVSSRHMLLLGLMVAPAHMLGFLLLPWDLAVHVLSQAGTALLAMAVLGVTFLGTLLLREGRRLDGARALRDSEARYRLLADNASDVIMRVSLDGVATYCSGAVNDLLGYRPAELIGGDFVDQVHPGNRRAASTLIDRLTPDHPRGTAMFQMRHKNGRWVWTEAAARLIADPRTGKPAEIVFVVRDVTERKRMEEDLEEARRAAESANQSKGLFLATLSHELRTPLNAIIGFGDLMAREALGPAGNKQYVQFSADIRDSGQHLLGLINEILDHAKAEAGHLTLEEDTVDLAAAVRFCTRMLSARAERSGVALVQTVAPEARYVRADEKRIRQILLNLLTNAVKYTPSGGRVAVTVSLDGGEPVIAVSDTGIGIDEKDLHRVFQAYEQVENPANRQITGTGLGLPLTRRLVELHGGRFELRSRVGEGSTFTVRLPAARLVNLSAPCAAVAQRVVPATILVVDDDALLRDGTALVLEGYGHRVLKATNANEALMVLGSGVPIQVLVTDVIMPPGMNGIELAYQARRLRPEIGIIVTSGFATHAVASSDDPNPGYEMLSKPFSALELKAKVDALLTAIPTTAPCAAAPQPPAGPAAGKDPLRVLVVDDLDTNCTLVAAILRLAGHTVDTVENGSQAIDAVQRTPYDLVLMDVQMPTLDGLEATRAIRALPPPAGRVPILALTAGTLPHQIQECRDAGMDGFVPKPIDRGTLLTAIAGAAADGPWLETPAEELPVLDEFILDELREALSDGSCWRLVDEVLNGLPGRMDALRAAADPKVVEGRAHALVSYVGNVGLQRMSARCRELCAAAQARDERKTAALRAAVDKAAAEGLDQLRSYRNRHAVAVA